VLIPEENVKDLQEIPENVKNGLEIVPVKWIDKVLDIALESKPTPLPETKWLQRLRPSPARWPALPAPSLSSIERTFDAACASAEK
jgi:ATP-dependent Lon protease